MKYLLLLPGSIAITLSDPYQGSLISALGAPLPSSYVALGTLKEKQFFLFLSLAFLCFFLGAGLNILGLASITLLLSFWHLSTAAAGTNSERHLVHSTLGTAFFLSTFPIDSLCSQIAALHLLVAALVVFRSLPTGLPPCWGKAKSPLGLAPFSAVLWLLPLEPQMVVTAAVVAGVTLWSSYNLSRSLALKH